MGDDQFSIIQHVMTNEAIKETRQRFAERTSNFIRQGINLSEGLGETMRDLDISPIQLFEQLHVVVSGDAESRSRLHHVPDDVQRIEHTRAPIHEITDKDRLPALGMNERLKVEG